MTNDFDQAVDVHARFCTLDFAQHSELAVKKTDARQRNAKARTDS